jgi:copper resistance protein B
MNSIFRLCLNPLRVLCVVFPLSVSSSAYAQDHSDHAGMDHSGRSAENPAPKASTDPHAGHNMEKTSADKESGKTGSSAKPPEPIPVLTPEDRAAAFPEISAGHAVHGTSIQRFVLLDRLETWDADAGKGLAWEVQGWVGGDINRLWIRSRGERVDDTTESSDFELLYGRSVARWWDVVAGIRHDIQPGASQDFAAIGVMGLAPYQFEVEATLYIGEFGQTAARLETETDILLTNRLILQPVVELNLYGKNDEDRGIGSGLSQVEAGLRLRYEIWREFAPYIGVNWEKVYGETEDFARAAGGHAEDSEIVLGLKAWF